MRRIKHTVSMTLVSLLVGLALGAVVIATLLQIFSVTHANYKLSQNIAEMNDVLRYASVTMTRVIQQAGYRKPDATSGLLPDYATAFGAIGTGMSSSSGAYNETLPNSNIPAGVVVSYFPGEDVIESAGGIDYGDKLWVRFYGHAGGVIRDCNDLYGDDTTPILVRFYSREVTVSGNDQTAFYCERHDPGTGYFYDPTVVYGISDAVFLYDQGAELIPAALFDRAWVRFGEDLTDKGYIDRWALGEDVADRTKVYAVRIAFLVHSRDDVRREDVTSTFSVFGETVTRTSKKLYQLYMFTVRMPNAPNYVLAAPPTGP